MRAAILDDNRVERERLADLLRTEELQIDTLGPSTIEETTGALGALLGEAGARVLLLDYRLDDAEEAAHFRGEHRGSAARR